MVGEYILLCHCEVRTKVVHTEEFIWTTKQSFPVWSKRIASPCGLAMTVL